jgi:CRP-like cAMP-binding protein
MLYSPTIEEIRLLGESSLLKKLDLPALKSVVAAATPLMLQRGGFFFHQGEPATSFFLLINGRVRLSQIADDGRQVIFHYFRAGEAMGVAVTMVGVNYPVSAEAMSDTLALGWDRNTSYLLMEKYPQLAINSLELVAERLWELQNRYRELATERVERRLARAILRLSEHLNPQPETSPTLRLSRQDLAEMTGTTLFSVSRICSDWEHRGILATGREQITILNKVDLQEIAEDLP